MSTNNPPLTRDDRAILLALRTLDAVTFDELQELLREGESPDSERVREYTEAISWLSWTLDPVEPRPGLEGSILTGIAGDKTQRVSIEDLRPEGPLSAAEEVEVPAETILPPVVEFRGSRPQSRLWMGLAATFAICSLGLGFLVFTLRTDLADQVAAVSRLSAELEGVRSDETRLASTAQMEEIRARMQLVTDTKTEICALRPPEDAEVVQPAALGLLFVAEDHQHWYLKAEGLEPLPVGRTYQLWFVVEDSDMPVSAATFAVTSDEEVRLGSPVMPNGTKAVLVTLEAAGGVEQPTGPVVLYGDEVMHFI